MQPGPHTIEEVAGRLNLLPIGQQKQLARQGIIATGVVSIRCGFHGSFLHFVSAKYQRSNARNCSRARERSDSTALGDLPVLAAIWATESSSTYFSTSTCRRSGGSASKRGLHDGSLFQMLKHVVRHDCAVQDLNGHFPAGCYGRAAPRQPLPPVQGNPPSGDSEQP